MHVPYTHVAAPECAVRHSSQPPHQKVPVGPPCIEKTGPHAVASRIPLRSPFPLWAAALLSTSLARGATNRAALTAALLSTSLATGAMNQAACTAVLPARACDRRGTRPRGTDPFSCALAAACQWVLQGHRRGADPFSCGLAAACEWALHMAPPRKPRGQHELAHAEESDPCPAAPASAALTVPCKGRLGCSRCAACKGRLSLCSMQRPPRLLSLCSMQRPALTRCGLALAHAHIRRHSRAPACQRGLQAAPTRSLAAGASSRWRGEPDPGAAASPPPPASACAYTFSATSLHRAAPTASATLTATGSVQRPRRSRTKHSSTQRPPAPAPRCSRTCSRPHWKLTGRPRRHAPGDIHQPCSTQPAAAAAVP